MDMENFYRPPLQKKGKFASRRRELKLQWLLTEHPSPGSAAGPKHNRVDFKAKTLAPPGAHGSMAIRMHPFIDEKVSEGTCQGSHARLIRGWVGVRVE
jgi:hypothetical protein